jgi:hypothetical protein
MGIKVSTADIAFSLAVRAAAGFECEHCGVELRIPNDAPEPFQPRSGAKGECCHLYGRRNAALRWDMLNAVSMCHGCHRMFTENPKLFTDWIESEFPQRWDRLNEKRGFVGVTNDGKTRSEVAKHYKQQLAGLAEAGRITSWI